MLKFHFKIIKYPLLIGVNKNSLVNMNISHYQFLDYQMDMLFLNPMQY